jgi:hypothetical protein
MAGTAALRVLTPAQRVRTVPLLAWQQPPAVAAVYLVTTNQHPAVRMAVLAAAMLVTMATKLERALLGKVARAVKNMHPVRWRLAVVAVNLPLVPMRLFLVAVTAGPGALQVFLGRPLHTLAVAVAVSSAQVLLAQAARAAAVMLALQAVATVLLVRPTRAAAVVVRLPVYRPHTQAGMAVLAS